LLNALQQRREYIKTTLENAENKLQEAEEKKGKYQQEMDNLDRHKKEQLQRLEEEIQRLKTIRSREMEEELKTLREKTLEQIEDEKNSLVDDILKTIYPLLGEFLTNIFRELADNLPEDLLLAKFLQKINELPVDVKTRLNKNASGELVLKTPRELTGTQKDLIVTKLREKQIFFTVISFQIDPALLAGHCLIAGNLSVNSHLGSISESFSGRLKQVI
jgi:F-type H+-transporting ATPase subunit b